MLEAWQLSGGWGSRRESRQRTGGAQLGHRASDAGVLIKAFPLCPVSPPSTPALSQQPSPALLSPLPTAPSFSPGTLDNVHRRT